MAFHRHQNSSSLMVKSHLGLAQMFIQFFTVVMVRNEPHLFNVQVKP
ncbi:unnamed protein product, partial [Brugia pahangi]|uniref:Uncharacterized protein n=1 Tax=Brugia pahangi TaxID=6280 RepID=A0A0N4TAW2_BRUPA